MQAKHVFLCMGLLWGWYLMAACAPQEPSLTLTPTIEPTQPVLPTPTKIKTNPPAPLLSASPTAHRRTELPLLTSTPDCVDNLRFVEDITIPDGSRVSSGEIIDKRWQVENAGTCNWDHRYRLRLLEGTALGVLEEQALYPARAGTQVEIRILFEAPTEPGIYRSAWEAVDPQGNAFGDPIYIEIQVTSPS